MIVVLVVLHNLKAKYMRFIRNSIWYLKHGIKGTKHFYTQPDFKLGYVTLSFPNKKVLQLNLCERVSFVA